MRIGLGTVQFGMDYGIANQQGKPNSTEIEQILTYAKDKRITVLDTAVAYGESERQIGSSLVGINDFNIVTKIPSFKQSSFGREVIPLIVEQFKHSLATLQVKKVYGLLLHNANDAFKNGGEYLHEAMLLLQQQGLVQKIGYSIYTSEQIDQLLSRNTFDLMQVPINLFDQRLLENGVLQKLKQMKIEIHARSIFLQGLIFISPDKLPHYFLPVRQQIAFFHGLLKQNEMTPLQAALGFALGIEELDIILCGVETKQQLMGICEHIPPIDAAMFSECIIQDERYINPALWAL